MIGTRHDEAGQQTNSSPPRDWVFVSSQKPQDNAQVRPVPLEYPRSYYENSTAPLPITPEFQAIKDLKIEWLQAQKAVPHDRKHAKQILIFEVEEYCIYKPEGSYRGEFELTSLHHLNVKLNELTFDGTLSFGGMLRYVEGILFTAFSIEGFGDKDTSTVTVYIQSQAGGKDKDFDIWYRLRRCSSEYQIFDAPFMWLATFAKHMIDYLGSKPRSTVYLHHFRWHFHKWLKKRFRGDHDFQKWIGSLNGATDFRHAVNAYVDFLYNQAFNLPNAEILLSHPVWSDCLRDATSVEQQEMKCKKTTTTSRVYGCFKGMYFGGCLEETLVDKTVQKARDSRMRSLGFAQDSKQSNTETNQKSVPYKPNNLGKVKVGDVISVKSDTNSKWKTTDHDWFAYVQRIEKTRSSDIRLYVLWLYRPEDTTISTMVYPITKELFLSDNCNCTEAMLTAADVTQKFSVDWHPKSLDTDKNFLVRQKYLADESAFVTLKDSDFTCRCAKRNTSTVHSKYRRGDCVYIAKKAKVQTGGEIGSKTILEPVIITGLQRTTNEVIVRRLLRLSRDCSEMKNNTRRRVIARNELVWTDELVTVSAHRLRRECQIRYFSIEDVVSRKIPTPYDRGGNGDFWIICLRLIVDESGTTLKPLKSTLPGPMNQGFDPEGAKPWNPLRGLSIFSGGGNFDRGLEEAGAVQFQTAVDISQEAVHTQKANARDPERLDLYCGSVDDHLKTVLKGGTGPTLPQVGDIQFLAAGSPCPGFSRMQPNWRSDQSFRNASHITTFCSYVDVFRPEFALLENVANMAVVRKGYEEEKVFSQVIGCLVALGYQTQQFVLDAWCHQSMQRRTRLFISITAPGLEPLVAPPNTHAHPEGTGARSLGKLSNGVRYGEREDYPTAFEHVTAEEATCDLPKIGLAISQICVKFPDHRVPLHLNRLDRAIVRHIPTFPPGQCYADAVKRGLPNSLIKNKKEVGKSWKRIKASGLIPTITTVVSPQDSRCGELLHWEQHRPITIQEARRAQGIPDYEVIIGSPMEQWRIIGNAVDRNVALALGLSLRTAWQLSYSRIPEQRSPQVEDEFETICRLSKDRLMDLRPNKVQIFKNVIAKTDHFVERTETEERTIDRLSVLTETTIESTRQILLKSKKCPILMLQSSITALSRPTPLPERPKRPRSSGFDEQSHFAGDNHGARRKTRHTGLMAEHAAKNWSKIVKTVGKYSK
ncbi:S-adenosyl-L-methionine-dependent methyltransferase [Zopfia rhizophila CBS 207.26]|uniref:DNA (cytosine-5-)-methyltransferase n=1 Tax=Zopfia rhizophila CBS 207.26 TaxID=1314779 RepID=A0A6A6ETI3_9PEZI|nr:S-adenosyl-L-methionine-dependent methyltransferase [Zopfia rhizophila CBS 207.26]